jgi:hypothetical protein
MNINYNRKYTDFKSFFLKIMLKICTILTKKLTSKQMEGMVATIPSI